LLVVLQAQAKAKPLVMHRPTWLLSMDAID
jgi:hypothetical protein